MLGAERDSNKRSLLFTGHIIIGRYIYIYIIKQANLFLPLSDGSNQASGLNQSTMWDLVSSGDIILRSSEDWDRWFLDIKLTAEAADTPTCRRRVSRS